MTPSEAQMNTEKELSIYEALLAEHNARTERRNAKMKHITSSAAWTCFLVSGAIVYYLLFSGQTLAPIVSFFAAIGGVVCVLCLTALVHEMVLSFVLNWAMRQEEATQLKRLQATRGDDRDTGS